MKKDLTESMALQSTKSEADGQDFGAIPDPQKVYEATRPMDWLTMPEPADDEIYMLFHIPAGSTSLLAFTVTCTGTTYDVALGTVENGTFVEKTRQAVDAGGTYEAELSADDWGDLTTDGFKQVMVKVSGTEINTFANAAHSQGGTVRNWNIVDIAAKLPHITRFAVGSASTTQSLSSLRYFRLIGQNQLKSCSGMFGHCTDLISVRIDILLDVTTCASMYLGCSSLVAAANVVLKTSAMTIANIYSGCEKLKAVPDIVAPNAFNMASAFKNCKELQIAPRIESAPIQTLTAAFTGCSSLVYVPPIAMALRAANITTCNGCTSLRAFPPISVYPTATTRVIDTCFKDCVNLQSILFDPNIEGWAGCTITLSGCNLGHTALVQLFKSLPTITTTKEITLTGNPGVSELTEEEKTIATEKGWTLTL